VVQLPSNIPGLLTHLLGSINVIERPFTPDGVKDLSDIWKRQGGDQITPNTRRLAKPNAILFSHMPLYVPSLPAHVCRANAFL